MADYGHNETEKILARLERQIAKTYGDASKELQKTIDDYFAKFVERDKKQLALLEQGKITKQQYEQWRLAQIGRGKRFEALRDQLAERATQANEVAIAYVNDTTPSVYSLNRNYAAYTIEQMKGDVGFTLWDEQTVKRLIVEEPDLMPNYPKEKAVKRGIDLEYGKKQITASVTSGILQGNSIGKIAKDLNHRITDMSMTSAVRAARTAVTGAQNAGRQDSYMAAEKMGIKVRKRWVATKDGRTRHSHAMLDGQTVDADEPFVSALGSRMMFPADARGAVAADLYNCRCTMITVEKEGIEAEPRQMRVRNPNTGQNELVSEMSYKEWAGWKKHLQVSGKSGILKDTVGIAQGTQAVYPEYSRLLSGSALENARKTNPKYATGEYEYTHNCQRCVPAWEMREKGFDVQAMPRNPRDESDSLETSPYSLWDFNIFDSDKSKRIQADREGTGKEKIVEFLKQCGDGARCEIVVEWDFREEGHAFCAKNIGGEVVFIDPQSGISGEPVEEYFTRVKSGTTTWLRIDQLKIREERLKEVVKNPYGND